MHHFLIYIDPGSGSYFIQVIVAAVFAAAFWIKMSWRRIVSFFSDRKNKRGKNPPGEQVGKNIDKKL